MVKGIIREKGLQESHKKIGIALIFVSVMIFAGVGVMGFEALSHWNPNVSNPVVSPLPDIVSYSSAGSISVGSSPEWAGYDSSNGYVYVTNFGSNSVSVISGTSVTATVDVGSSPEGVGYDSSNNYIYVANDGSGSVSVISGTSVTATVDVGSYPEGVAYDSSNSYIYVVNGGYTYDSVFVISGTSAIANISVGSEPEGVAYDSSDNYVYVANGGSNSVSYFDEPPPLSVSITSSGSTVDVGQSVTFTATGSGGIGSYSYQWYLNGNAVSGATSSTYTTSFGSSGDYSVYVVITDTGDSATSNTITETVDSDPSISISSSRNPSDAGQSVDFSTSVSGGTGSYSSYSYILYDGTSTSDSQLASGSTSSFSYTFSSTGSFLLDYSVTDTNGYTQSTSLTQTVNSDPSVSISSSQNPTDQGNSVTFSSSVSGGTSPYSYSWTIGGASVSSASSFSYTFSSSGSYAVQLTVTDATGYQQTQSLTETVNSDPVVSASSNVSSADVNYPIEFSSSPSGGTGGYTYEWTLNGNQVSTSQDFSYTFTSAGSYTFDLTITDSVGVSSSTSVTVKINPNPTVSIASSQNPTDTGNSVTFTSSEQYGTGTISYSWLINGGQVATASSFSYTFSSSGSYTVEVIVTDSDGHTASASLTETVNAKPSISIFSSNQVIDAGQSATFTASVSGGTSPYNYSWTINGNTYYGNPVSYLFSSSGSYGISLTVTDAVGVSATASLTETVNADPSVTASSNVSSTDAGTPVKFTASVSGGTSPYNYSWSLGSTVLSYASSFSYTFTSTGTHTLNVTVRDANGETSQSSVSVKIAPDPSVSISSSQDPTDAGNTIAFTSSVSGGTGTISYNWTVNGVNEGTASGLDYKFANSGAYSVSLEVTDATGHTASASLTETVNADPSVSITASHDPTDIGIAVNFSSTATGGVTPYNYSWSLGGNVVSYASSFSYTFTSAGSYSVQLTVTDQAGVTATASLTETVYSDPVATINPEYATIDKGLNDTFTSSVSGGDYPMSYSWSYNGSVVSTKANLTMNFTTLGYVTVSLTVTDALGEKSSTSVQIDVLVDPSVYIEGSNKTDLNILTVYTGYGNFGEAPYNYTWAINGVNEGSGLYLEYKFPVTGVYNLSLTITDSLGGKASSYMIVHVYSVPTLTIGASNLTTDQGYMVTFTSSVTGGSSPILYDWTINGNTVGTGSGLQYVFPTSGSYSVQLTVTDQAGVTATASLTETVNAPLGVEILPGHSQIDAGINDTFTSSVTGGSSPYAYTWSVHGIVLGHNSTLSYGTETIGSYNLTLTVSDAFNSISKQTVDIIVYADPSAIILSQGNVTDVGITFLARGSAVNGSGMYNFTWTLNGDYLANGQILEYAFTSAGDYVLGLTVRDSYGATSSASMTVRVNADPSITVIVAHKSIDAGMSDLVNLTISGGTSPYEILWLVDGGQVGNGMSLDYAFTSPGKYNLTVILMDTFGKSTRYTSIITVNPDLSVSFSPSPDTIDLEMTDVFTSNVSGGTGTISYNWTVNGVNEGTSGNLSYFFGSAGAYVIGLSVSDSLGSVQSSKYDFIVHGNPQAQVISGANKTDVGVYEEYRGDVLNGTGAFNYTWIAGGHVYYGQTVTFAFQDQGNYSVQLTVSDAYGRDGTTAMTVSVYPDPVATLVAKGTARVSLPYNLSVTIQGGISPYSVVWKFPDGQQEIGQSVQHVFSSSGSRIIQVSVSDASGYAGVYNYSIDVSLYVTISASQTSGIAPLNVSFNSDVIGGTSYTYSWVFGNGQTSVIADPSTQYTTGNYTATLTVRAINGATGNASVNIYALPFPYTISYSPNTNITVLTPVLFTIHYNYDASASDHNVTWRFPNGQTYNGNSVNYTFPVYQEINDVIVSAGSHQDIVQVVMTPATPTAKISGVGLSHVMAEGSIILLSGVNSTSPDASIQGYQWVINGQITSGQETYLILNNTGAYNITLIVTDTLGASGQTSYSIQSYRPESNSTIAITVTQTTSGALVTYHIGVISSAGVEAIEGMINDKLVTVTPVNESGDEYNYSITVNQGDYSAGVYQVSVIAFNNNSQSNEYNTTLLVSQAYAKSSFNIVQFFGGTTNFLMFILTLAGVIIAYIGIRGRDTDDIVIQAGNQKIPIGKDKHGKVEIGTKRGK